MASFSTIYPKVDKSVTEKISQIHSYMEHFYSIGIKLMLMQIPNMSLIKYRGPHVFAFIFIGSV